MSPRIGIGTLRHRLGQNLSGRFTGGFRRCVAAVGLAVLLLASTDNLLAADGVKTPPPAPKGPGPKRIPPAGIDVPPEMRAALQKELDAFRQEIDKLGVYQSARVHSLLPDVQIYWQAAHNALADNEFFQPREIDAAFDLL